MHEIPVVLLICPPRSSTHFQIVGGLHFLREKEQLFWTHIPA